MPIFEREMSRINPEDTVDAVKTIEKYIRYIQEQLEYALYNLDSDNITRIEADKTEIIGLSTSSGGTVSGDNISISGKNGEAFKVGYDDTTNRFVFEVKGKNGVQYLYLTPQGELVITKNSNLSIDSGTWD